MPHPPLLDSGIGTQLTANARKVGETRKKQRFFADFTPHKTIYDVRLKSQKRALTCQLTLVVLQKVQLSLHGSVVTTI